MRALHDGASDQTRLLPTCRTLNGVMLAFEFVVLVSAAMRAHEAICPANSEHIRNAIVVGAKQFIEFTLGFGKRKIGSVHGQWQYSMVMRIHARAVRYRELQSSRKNITQKDSCNNRITN